MPSKTTYYFYWTRPISGQVVFNISGQRNIDDFENRFIKTILKYHQTETIWGIFWGELNRF